MTNQSLTASNLKYLLTVAQLSQKGRVRCVDVSKYLAVSRPSALRALEYLQTMELLLRREGGAWELSPGGQALAAQYRDYYQVIGAFYCRLLPPEVNREAFTLNLLAEVPLGELESVCEKLQ